jgi:hypothetical protein
MIYKWSPPFVPFLHRVEQPVLVVVYQERHEHPFCNLRCMYAVASGENNIGMPEELMAIDTISPRCDEMDVSESRTVRSHNREFIVSYEDGDVVVDFWVR